VCCSGYDSREGLVRNRAEVGHSKAKSAQSGVKAVECDAGFGFDETFFSIDLFGGDDTENGGNGRLPVSDRAWTERVIYKV